MEHVDENETS